MTQLYFALTIPVDRKLRVAREPDKSVEVDVDAISRLVAIANSEGLRGKEIVGLFVRRSRDSQYLHFEFEHVEPSQGYQS
jgi:hypothetical protein